MGLSAFIDMVGRDLLNPLVLFFGIIAGVIEGSGFRIGAAVIASLFIEFQESQAEPSFEWAYAFSWQAFAAQTLACIIIALAIGWLVSHLNKIGKRPAT